MKRRFPLLILLLSVVVGGCSHNVDLGRPKSQDNVGVEMARMNLWREAMFRFRRAVQLNPSDAMAHNNLAVAYEAVGDFDDAAREYREALRLDRTNAYIQKNYSRYTEFMSRSKKRQQRRDVKAAGATTTTSTPPAEAAAAPETGTASATPAGTSAAAPPSAGAPPSQPASPPPAVQPAGSPATAAPPTPAPVTPTPANPKPASAPPATAPPTPPQPPTHPEGAR